MLHHMVGRYYMICTSFNVVGETRSYRLNAKAQRQRDSIESG